MGAGRHALVVAGFILVTCSLSRAVFAGGVHATIRIVSVYRIDLGDFNLGDFRFTTLLKGAEYRMRAKGISPCSVASSTIGEASRRAQASSPT